MNSPASIAQLGLTDDEIEAIALKHVAPGAKTLREIVPGLAPYQQSWQFQRIKAFLVDALAARRTPVADERAADAATLLGKYKALCIEIGRGDSYHLGRIDAAIAALASAPAACATDVCQAGQSDGVLCADDECDRASGVRPASAPVAGEAVAWKIYDAALGKHILTENSKVADMLLREGENTVRPLVYGDAAPQASAEGVRNAALEQAAALCESWMMAKTATHLQDMANQTMRRMADYIRALKQPQADKDAAPCTCPSGDGSLRHPCAEHAQAEACEKEM